MIDSSFLCYAKNYEGYKKLIKLSTIQSERQITFNDIENSSDIIIIIPYKYNNIFGSLKTKVKDIYIGYSNKKEELDARIITNKVVYINDTRYINIKDSGRLTIRTFLNMYQAYKDTFDTELLLTLSKKTYADIEKESNKSDEFTTTIPFLFVLFSSILFKFKQILNNSNEAYIRRHV